MSKRKTWKCNFRHCPNVAEYYRDVKGTLVKLCLHHDVQMRKERMGKPVDFTELSYEDILDLEEKDIEWIRFQCPKCGLKVIVTVEMLNDNGEYLCPICKTVMSRM